MISFKHHIFILLTFPFLVSTSYANDWLCLDNADNSVYKVKIADGVINYVYPNPESNKAFNVIKIEQTDIVYAVSSLELTRSANKNRYCRVCLKGGVIVFDIKNRTVYRSSIVLNGNPLENSYQKHLEIEGVNAKDSMIKKSYQTDVWESQHKCQLDFKQLDK